MRFSTERTAAINVMFLHTAYIGQRVYEQVSSFAVIPAAGFIIISPEYMLAWGCGRPKKSVPP